MSYSNPIQLPWLDESPHFPHPSTALEEPDGLLAAGGDLSPQRLISAYSQGIFPWYSAGEPIMWWSPNPRTVIFPDHIHISRSLKKHIKRQDFSLSFDHAFTQVIQACSEPRMNQPDTWITGEMKAAYIHLHDLGYAHSIEYWGKNTKEPNSPLLLGGLYGIAIGSCFFGESMFSRVSNASKVVITALAATLHQWGFQILDCQVSSEHLYTLGAEDINRDTFLQLLKDNISSQPISQALLKPAQKWDSESLILPI